ncbi:hypothetical protein MC885_000016, partial [Smutsia gigantea]
MEMCRWLWKRSSVSVLFWRRARKMARMPLPVMWLESRFRLVMVLLALSMMAMAKATWSSARVLARANTLTAVLNSSASAKRTRISLVMQSELLTFTSVISGSLFFTLSRGSSNMLGAASSSAAAAGPSEGVGGELGAGCSADWVLFSSWGFFSLRGSSFLTASSSFFGSACP